VALVQRCSLLALPFSMLLALLLRYLSSVKLNYLLLRAAALAIVLNLVMDLLLAKKLGVRGDRIVDRGRATRDRRLPDRSSQVR
jgi:hypothetical protein